MSEEANSGSDGRELKNLPRVNYSKMCSTGLGEFQCATRGVPAVSSQEISAVPPLKLESEGPDEEIRKIREEMKKSERKRSLIKKVTRGRASQKRVERTEGNGGEGKR